MHLTNRLTLLALAATTTTTLASPILQARDGPVKVTADQLGQIAPKLKSCDRAKDAECATADNAALFISNSFDTYKITSPAVAAALIATMAKESGEFVYAHNVSPGVPGQGTRNMQSPKFNKMYLDSLTDPAFKAEKDAAGDDPVKVLRALNTYGNYDFGSAAWFLTSQCKESADALDKAKADQKGWDDYVKCVGATPGDGRLDYWKKAVQVLGVK